MISRGKSRFVDELHIPNAEVRSSPELLSELQTSEGGELCLTKTKTTRKLVRTPSAFRTFFGAVEDKLKET